MKRVLLLLVVIVAFVAVAMLMPPALRTHTDVPPPPPPSSSPSAPTTSAPPPPPGPAPNAEPLAALIEQLDKGSVEERERAERELLQAGNAAAPYLAKAATRPEPELAARAKALLERLRIQNEGYRPYAEALPAQAVFFAEVPQPKKFFEHWLVTPAARIWATEPVKQWWGRKQNEEWAQEDRRVWELLDRATTLLDGPAGAFIGTPAALQEPSYFAPLVLLFDSRSAPGQLESVLRERQGLLGEESQGTHQEGPYTVEDYPLTQLLANAGRSALSYSPQSLKEYISGMQQKPLDNLAPFVETARALSNEPDLVLTASRRGLLELIWGPFDADGRGQRLLEALGMANDARLFATVNLQADGVHERYQAHLTKVDGLLNILAHLELAPLPGAEKGEALEALPVHTALWISLRGNLAAKSEELARALRTLDELYPPAQQVDPATGQPLKNDGALSNVHAFERIGGLKLEQALAQLSGPLELGVLMKSIPQDGALVMDPLGLIASALVKDPQLVQSALAGGTKDAFEPLTHEALRGGDFYYFKSDPRQPGWWLKDKRLLFASERVFLDLALNALEHKAGNERLTDRAGVARALERKAFAPEAAVWAYADAGQLFDMPYSLLRFFGHSIPELNAWPLFEDLKPVLSGLPVLLQLKAGAAPDEVRLEAQTPFSLPAALYLFTEALQQIGW